MLEEQIKLQKENSQTQNKQQPKAKASSKNVEDEPIKGTGAKMSKWKMQSL